MRLPGATPDFAAARTRMVEQQLRRRGIADERVAGLDAAVQDADADALAGRAAPGPLACDALRPVDADRNLVAGAGREAPGREALGVLVSCGLFLGHSRIVRLWRGTS